MADRTKAEQLVFDALDCDPQRVSEIVEYVTAEGISQRDVSRTLVRLLIEDKIVVYEDPLRGDDPEVSLALEPEVRRELGRDKVPLLSHELSDERVMELARGYLKACLEGGEKAREYAEQAIFESVMEAAFGKSFWSVSNRVL
jgi:hypothetical protein